MPVSFNPREVNPRGLDELVHRPPEELVERDGSRHLRYRCPFTGFVVRMSGIGHGDSEHRGLCHFAHRWSQAARHLREAGLAPEEMLQPLGLLFDRIFAESEREAWLELGICDSRSAVAILQRQNEARRRAQLGAAMPPMFIGVDLAFADGFTVGYTNADPAAEKRRKKAAKTARDLLVKCLTDSQRADFEINDAFDVEVTSCGRIGPRHSRDDPLGQHDHEWRAGTYRIARSATFNVSHTESGTRYCVVAAEAVPVYDQMLTQKLLLENEPAKFFATANVSMRPLVGYRSPDHPRRVFDWRGL